MRGMCGIEMYVAVNQCVGYGVFVLARGAAPAPLADIYRPFRAGYGVFASVGRGAAPLADVFRPFRAKNWRLLNNV